ncbi:hypothetical protein J8L85_03910 [Maribacter sp. MMG018]|uniref:hypothetical protein n=1 Tax=Maribacter sp. MMG018 TaxID=2822688 RepID=UPI001B35868F|nr:hypothetical protein [Maribacter sp. MMG018]MBQ4913568.1 hypothetical protein [Maribacter sp. MMG018]
MLGLLPFLLISNSGKEIGLVDLEYDKTYLSESDLKAYVAYPSKVEYHTNHEKLNEGGFYNTLMLSFGDIKDSSKATMEFLISEKGESKELSKGIYPINEIEGFINNFDGVFGVANVNKLGEKPFFAKKGFIQINELNIKGVKGYMDVTLVNEIGMTIRVTDNFDTYK